MLALSPPLFSSNLGWPLEDPIGHEEQNYFFTDIETTSDHQSLYLNFPTPTTSDQRPPSEFDRSATPSNTIINSDLSMVKKLNHNASERVRRKKINHLYSSLRILLPASGHTKKLSIPATVSRVLKYIPELQQQVEGLVRKREELLSKLNSTKQGINNQIHHQEINQIKSTAQTPLSSVSASQLNDNEVVIQVSTYKVHKNQLSVMLHNLEEDGLSLLNASSFESFGGRVFHNLHLQVEGSYSMECGTLGDKLMSLCASKEELFF
ncbi:Basic helix-loop-helix transcription factor [Parasponia andersonii]|uniref:Basic helix-loop-helix transcription factor n=1 Tax=Parasponia andersonii TaxID=3476 RepID=A0A2P5AQ44_PARAD|nr:Basic helix-loop-helix transcription factor [Parasponia andersonii]